MSETFSYAHRPRPFGHEVAYRLEPEGLYVDTGRRTETIPYRDILAVRLAYQPTNVGAAGFRARLRLAGRRTLTLSNLSWKSWVDVERRDAAYRRFVTALIERAADAHPGLDCKAGQPVLLWGGVVLVGIVTAVALLWAAATALQRGSWPIAVLAAMVLLAFGWQAREMASRNRPAAFGPGRWPEAVLPPA
jgi:hypothetical protein